MSLTSKAPGSEAKRSKEYFDTSAPTICFSLVWMKMHGLIGASWCGRAIPASSTTRIPIAQRASGVGQQSQKPLGVCRRGALHVIIEEAPDVPALADPGPHVSLLTRELLIRIAPVIAAARPVI